MNERRHEEVDFKALLVNHIHEETSDLRAIKDRLDAGDKRMEAIETALTPLVSLVTTLRGMIVIGRWTWGLVLVILMMAGYVYFKDQGRMDAAIKLQQEMLIGLKLMQQSHQELERDTRRELERYEQQLKPRPAWSPPPG